MKAGCLLCISVVLLLGCARETRSDDATRDAPAGPPVSAHPAPDAWTPEQIAATQAALSEAPTGRVYCSQASPPPESPGAVPAEPSAAVPYRAPWAVPYQAPWAVPYRAPWEAPPDAAPAETPPGAAETARPGPRRPSFHVKKDKLSGALPHLPHAIAAQLRGRTVDSIYKICIDGSGAVISVSTVQSTGFLAADASIIRTLCDWRFQPQTIRICFISRFSFLVAP